MGQKPLSKHSQGRVDEMSGHLESIKTLTGKVKIAQITDLIRRAAIPIARDGYPANSMPEWSSGGGTSDPTGTIAAGQVDSDRRPRDMLGQSARRVERELRKAEKALLEVVGILEGEQRQVEKKKSTVGTASCTICTASAEKSGWCTSDYNDWWRHGSPDRHLWEMYKRKDVDRDGVRLVLDCPRPSGDNKAIRGPWRTGPELP